MDEEHAQALPGHAFLQSAALFEVLEIIPGPDTLPEVVARMAVLRDVLGKGSCTEGHGRTSWPPILTFMMSYIMHEMTRTSSTDVRGSGRVDGAVIGHASSARSARAIWWAWTRSARRGERVYGCRRRTARFDGSPGVADEMLEKGYYGREVGFGVLQEDGREE